MGLCGETLRKLDELSVIKNANKSREALVSFFLVKTKKIKPRSISPFLLLLLNKSINFKNNNL